MQGDPGLILSQRMLILISGISENLKNIQQLMCVLIFRNVSLRGGGAVGTPVCSMSSK